MDLKWRDFILLAGMPVRERVIDRLVDLLLDADDVLVMLETEDASSIRWVKEPVLRAYEHVDAVMRRLTD